MSAQSVAVPSSHARDVALFECAGILQSGASAPLLRWRVSGEQYVPGHAMHGVPEVGFDEVLVRFELKHDQVIDFLQLAIPTVAGRYLVTQFVVGGESVPDLGSRVIAADEQWGPLPGNRHGIVIESASGRPWFEVDVRDIAALRLVEGSPRTVDVVIRRQPPLAESTARLGAELRRIDATLHSMGSQLVEVAIGHDDALRHQFRAVEDTGHAVTIRHDAQELRLGAMDSQARDDHAVLLAAFRETGSRLDAIEAQVDALARKITSTMESGLARLSDQIASSEAARDMSDARSSDALVALQTAVERSRHAIENVFWRRWRRWLRRLRGRQDS